MIKKHRINHTFLKETKRRQKSTNYIEYITFNVWLVLLRTMLSNVAAHAILLLTFILVYVYCNATKLFSKTNQ